MKEWLTVMTSSPGTTPAASSARWSAVVQFDTATACGAPTNAANSRSNAATSGPCVSHPDRMTRPAASTSASPTRGLAIGINETVLDICRPLCRSGAEGFLFPPVDQTLQAFYERDPGLEPDRILRPLDRREAPRHRIDLPLRPVIQGRRAAHHAGEQVRHLLEAGLCAAGDVEHVVGDRRFGRQHVRARDV